MRRLFPIEVLGRWALARVDGLLGLLGVLGVLGARSIPMLCLLAVAAEGGVFSLTLTQSSDCTADDNDDFRMPKEVWAPDERRGRVRIVAVAEEDAGEDRPSGLGVGSTEEECEPILVGERKAIEPLRPGEGVAKGSGRGLLPNSK